VVIENLIDELSRLKAQVDATRGLLGISSEQLDVTINALSRYENNSPELVKKARAQLFQLRLFLEQVIVGVPEIEDLVSAVRQEQLGHEGKIEGSQPKKQKKLGDNQSDSVTPKVPKTKTFGYSTISYQFMVLFATPDINLPDTLEKAAATVHGANWKNYQVYLSGGKLKESNEPARYRSLAEDIALPGKESEIKKLLARSYENLMHAQNGTTPAKKMGARPNDDLLELLSNIKRVWVPTEPDPMERIVRKTLQQWGVPV
jgi:hypothetical protein